MSNGSAQSPVYKKVGLGNLSRFRQKSLSELNEVTQALGTDIEQIVGEVDALEQVTPQLAFDNSKGVIVTPGVVLPSGETE